MKGEGIRLDKDKFAQLLGIPVRHVEVALKYLVEAGLLKGTFRIGSDVPFIFGIATMGIDFVENPTKFGGKFAINQQTIQVGGNVYGSIAQAQENSQTVQTIVTFEDVEKLIEQHKEVDPPEREKIKELLGELRNELSKESHSSSRLTTLLEHFKKYGWLYYPLLELATKTLLSNSQ